MKKSWFNLPKKSDSFLEQRKIGIFYSVNSQRLPIHVNFIAVPDGNDSSYSQAKDNKVKCSFPTLSTCFITPMKSQKYEMNSSISFL